MKKEKNIKQKDSIFTSLVILTVIILLINVFLNIFISIFMADVYYMSDLRKYMKEQYELIEKNYDDVFELDLEYSIYDMRLEQYDTLENKIIYSSRKNRTDKNISNSLTREEMNQIFDDLLEKEKYYIFTIEDDKYSIIDSLLQNEQEQIIMLAQHSENNYFVLQIPSPNIIYATSLSKKYAVYTMAFSFAMMFPVVSLFSYFFTKPINDLYVVTEKIKNKNFKEKCKVGSKNEIGLLAQSINEMSDSMNSYINEIEEKNIQLEKDLRIKEKFELSQKKFVSDVSHEIKTPISIISAYTEGLKMGLATTQEEIDEYCNIILDECSRMSSITKQLLYLSKLENNTTKLNISSFDIIELIKDDIAKFKLKCEQNNIKLSLFSAFDNLMVDADKEAIENVVLNYLQNAFKYCLDPGKIEISIIEEKSGLIYIGIYNNGNKFSDEDIEKIWDRFYKKDEARTRNEESTGLGLSIVKATMELHNMPYGVVNKKDGVEFFIKLKKHKNNI